VSFAEEEAIDCLLIAMASVPSRLWSGTPSGSSGARRHVNLKAQKPVRQSRVMRGQGKENFSVRVLTKEGKRLAERQGAISKRAAVLCRFCEAAGGRTRCRPLSDVSS
jgi:hypothetical protein